MRDSFLFILLVMIVHAACKNKTGKKYFTGTIEYSYTYSSDSLNADSLTMTRPAKSDFRYDLINYQSRFIKQDTEIYYYSGKLNKCIAEINSQKNYTCEDYGLMTDSVISWKIYDTDEKVLELECRVLEIQKKTSWVKYHVSKDLRIAPVTYQQHRSYNWDIYGEKARGGLILRSEHRFKKFTMMGIATGIKSYADDFVALELEEKLFAEICNRE